MVSSVQPVSVFEPILGRIVQMVKAISPTPKQVVVGLVALSMLKTFTDTCGQWLKLFQLNANDRAESLQAALILAPNLRESAFNQMTHVILHPLAIPNGDLFRHAVPNYGFTSAPNFISMPLICFHRELLYADRDAAQFLITRLSGMIVNNSGVKDSLAYSIGFLAPTYFSFCADKGLLTQLTICSLSAGLLRGLHWRYFVEPNADAFAIKHAYATQLQGMERLLRCRMILNRMLYNRGFLLSGTESGNDGLFLMLPQLQNATNELRPLTTRLKEIHKEMDRRGIASDYDTAKMAQLFDYILKHNPHIFSSFYRSLADSQEVIQISGEAVEDLRPFIDRL